jgi:hypothetical protein
LLLLGLLLGLLLLLLGAGALTAVGIFFSAFCAKHYITLLKNFTF